MSALPISALRGRPCDCVAALRSGVAASSSVPSSGSGAGARRGPSFRLCFDLRFFVEPLARFRFLDDRRTKSPSESSESVIRFLLISRFFVCQCALAIKILRKIWRGKKDSSNSKNSGMQDATSQSAWARRRGRRVRGVGARQKVRGVRCERTPLCPKTGSRDRTVPWTHGLRREVVGPGLGLAGAVGAAQRRRRRLLVAQRARGRARGGRTASVASVS